MLVTLTQWHSDASCVWCERSTVCVTASIDEFLTTTPLCWTCLAKAVKVRTQQERPPSLPEKESRPLCPGGPNKT